MSEICFDGLYHREGKSLWLRFHSEAKVGACYLPPKMGAKVAAERLHIGQGGYGRGDYRIEGDAVELEVHFPMGVRRFTGVVGGETLRLAFVDERKTHPAIEYSFYRLESEELAPPQASVVHEFRERLSRGEVKRERAEAAAAIGDATAALACRAFFEVGEVSRRFAELGPEASLRMMLALCWSDDGEWYTPKQGVTTDGSRKCEEGKVLRSVAKWCVKPSKRLVSKAEEQYDEIVRVGPGYEYLDAMLDVMTAETEEERAVGLRKALTLHLAQDVIGGYERVRAMVVPWLVGREDPLAEMLEGIK